VLFPLSEQCSLQNGHVRPLGHHMAESVQAAP